MQKGKSALPFLFKLPCCPRFNPSQVSKASDEVQHDQIIMETTNNEKADLTKAILTFCIVEAAWQKRLHELSDCYEFNIKPHYCNEHELLYNSSRAKMEVDMAFYEYIKSCNLWHSYVEVIELCCEAGLSAVSGREEIVSFTPPSYMGDYILGKTDTLSSLISKYIEFCSNPRSGNSPNYRRKLMEYQNSFIYFIKAVYDKRMEL